MKSFSRSSIRYGCGDNILQHVEPHIVDNDTTRLDKFYTYDRSNRAVRELLKLNSVVMGYLYYTYNDLGQLSGKTFMCDSSFLQRESLSYNLRGWLTGMSSSVFKMNLRYESPAFSGTAARYNGSISEWEWQQGSNPAQMYSFAYDGLDRLENTSGFVKSGSSWQPSSASYVEKGLSYDLNGNLCNAHDCLHVSYCNNKRIKGGLTVKSPAQYRTLY